MICTHKCSSCKCRIKDVNGYDACAYIGHIKNQREIAIIVGALDDDALCHYNSTKLLYFFDDGLYLYNPIKCYISGKNFKFIDVKDKYTNEHTCYRFEKKDKAWVNANAKKTILEKVNKRALRY